MIHSSKVVYCLIIGLILLASASCGSTEDLQPTEDLRPTEDLQPTEVSEIQQFPAITEKIIDGEMGDWEERFLLGQDPKGDAEGDFLDLTNVSVFINQEALYLMIELANPAAPFVQFDLEFFADGRWFLLTWRSDFPHVGQLEDSVFAMGNVLEGRINLEELGSPQESVEIMQIRVMAGESPPSESWRSVDEYNPPAEPLAWVNEEDSYSWVAPVTTPIPEPTPKSMGSYVWVIVTDTSADVESDAATVTKIIEERTGKTIEIVILDDYSQLVNGFCSGEYHFGVLPPLYYLLAVGNGCTQGTLIAKINNSNTTISQILINHERDISSVADLPGAVFCRTSPESMSSWIIPSLMMQAEGMDPVRDLAEIVDSGSPDEIISAVYGGDCDAGATYFNARIPAQNRYPDVLEVVPVLADSMQFPNRTFTFWSGMPDEERITLETVLLELEQVDEGQVLNDLYDCDGFEKMDDSFYDSLRIFINDTAGVNIESLVP